MLRIWGRLSSINVQKVVWCADELDLPYERTEAGGTFGVVDTPQYLAMNPNGLVPLIEDDGFVLWESNAIVRYLAARHGEGSLWPIDLRLRAEADRWMDWQNFTYWPAMLAAFRGLVRTAPKRSATPRPSRLPAASRKQRRPFLRRISPPASMWQALRLPWAISRLRWQRSAGSACPLNMKSGLTCGAGSNGCAHATAWPECFRCRWPDAPWSAAPMPHKLHGWV